MAKVEKIDITPKPGEEQCDFCSSKDIKWGYPCKSFRQASMTNAEGKTVHLDSITDWAACDECSALIEADDRMGLVKRSFDSYPGEKFPTLEAVIASLHGNFFTLRSGPCYPDKPISKRGT